MPLSNLKSNVMGRKFIITLVFYCHTSSYVSVYLVSGYMSCIVCLFVLLLYAPSQQLWSWRDCQFTSQHFFLGKLEQAVNQYFVHILSLVTDNNPS